MNNPFDELAKALVKAKELPRRDALRLIGGGLAGAVLASFGVGKAFGQGNSECAHFCTSVFPPGKDRGKCISDAAHGEGLCFQCGPAAPPGDHGPLCGQVCCEAGQVCQDGTCVTTGVCSGTSGGCGQSSMCGDNCFCFETTEGGVACTSDVTCGRTQPLQLERRLRLRLGLYHKHVLRRESVCSAVQQWRWRNSGTADQLRHRFDGVGSSILK